MNYRILTVLLCLALMAGRVSASGPLKNADEERINSLIEQMTLEEKVRFCYGCDMGFAGLDRLDIPVVPCCDGPRGPNANAATDVEFQFPFGFKELEGIHSRTDFDLGNHQKFSGKKIQYFDPETGESYVPYVIETSIGVDRMVLAVLSHSYKEEKLENGETRVVLGIPAPLAPVKAAVLPLLKNNEDLVNLAQSIMDDLKYDFNCQYDEKDSIGKRYRRQDAIGTPFCITVDHDSLQDNCVTVRERDTMTQKRVPIAELRSIIDKEVNMNNLLRNLK